MLLFLLIVFVNLDLVNTPSFSLLVGKIPLILLLLIAFPSHTAKTAKWYITIYPSLWSLPLHLNLVKIRIRLNGWWHYKKSLDDAVKSANEKMINKVPPSEMTKRRIVAGIFATIVFGVFFGMFIYIWKIFTPKEIQTQNRQSNLRKYWLAYVMLIPAVGSVLLFKYLPLLRGAVMAFQDYNVLTGFSGSKWVGLDNFASILWDPLFWGGLWCALKYTFFFIFMVFVPPIFLAILLSEIPVGKVFFRVVFYLPTIITGIVMMILWKKFFDVSDAGFANKVVSTLTFGQVGPLKWLKSENMAMFSIMIPLCWQGMGMGCLIYLAALKTVPEDLYESAAIDGAGFFRRIWYISIPMIKALILIQFIFALIMAFQAANYVLIMTGGGPNDSTRVIGLEIFYNAVLFAICVSVLLPRWVGFWDLF